MPRIWIWVQLFIGWLPVWVLFTLLMMSAHQASAGEAGLIALRMIVAAAVLGIAVYRFTARLHWPHPFRLRFVAQHVVAAGLYSTIWLLLNSLIESAFRQHWVMVIGPGLGPYLVTGVWLYAMIAGVAYASHAATRAAQTAALEARTRLAALRAQMHPHFLFNALHTVVQLIPVDPRGAVRAAEQLAGALRVTIEEQRDQVPLSDEWDFVNRYLEIEGIRFGDRLRVRAHLDAVVMQCHLPTFALQTLVENAVRHAAAPRVEPTEIDISATQADGVLILSVSDNGLGADLEAIERGAGTGLRRLRERLSWLYGSSARLELSNGSAAGFTACLRIPQHRSEAPPGGQDND
jgi:signal transduction histidine kinase